MTGDLATFLGVVLALTVVPGVDMALVQRSALVGGMRAVWPTLAGIVAGLAVHVALCVAGLSVLVRSSGAAFTTLQLLGAAWLAWIGVGVVRDGLARRRCATTPGGGDRIAAQTRGHFAKGFVTNLLNVKIVVFYLALLPQFAPTGERFVPVALALAVTQIAIGVVWLASYGALVARSRGALAGRPVALGSIEVVTGLVLVGLALQLALVPRVG